MTLQADSRPLTVEAVAASLKALGLASGDQVMVHSDLRRFGMARDAAGRLALALPPAVLHAALDGVLGDGGTIVVPTFSYSWTRGQVFRPLSSPSFEGSFSEYIRVLSGAKRSLHPLMSVAAMGPAADDLLEGVDQTSFGPQSPYGRMHRANTKHLAVGVSVCSFADYAQWACRVPYRYPKRFRGLIERQGRIWEAECEHCVRYLDQDLEPKPVFDVLEGDRSGRIRQTRLTGEPMRLVSSRDLFDLMQGRIAEDPFAFSTKPKNERVLGRLAELFSRDNGLRMFALNQAGIERWAWIIPSRSRRLEVTIEGGDGAAAAALAQEMPEVFLDSSCCRGVDEHLSGAEVRDHVVADLREVTSERLATAQWLIHPTGNSIPPGGHALPLITASPYRIRIRVSAGSPDETGAIPYQAVALPKEGGPGVSLAIEVMSRWRERGNLEVADGALEGLIATVLERAPSMAWIREGGAASITRIPAFAPDLAGGLEGARPVEMAQAG